MPWINGRFYANPLFGRELERTRAADEGRIWSEDVPELERQTPHGVRSEESVALWRHPNDRHSGRSANFADDAKREQAAEKERSPVAKVARHLETRKINKIYNEFSGLRPKEGVTTAEDLNRARRNAAHVYHNVGGKKFQGKSTLGSSDARDIKIAGTPAAQAYQATRDAVAAAASGPDTTQNANHVYIYDPKAIHSRDVRPPRWVTLGETTTIAGPFINESGGGDIPRGDEIYVITVNDRNMRHANE